MKSRLLFAHLAFLSPISAEVVSFFDFSGGFPSPTLSSDRIDTSDYDARSSELGANVSAVSSGTETTFMRASVTPEATTAPSLSDAYHQFSVTPTGLATGEALTLEALEFDYSATNISGTFTVAIYSSLTGFSQGDAIGSFSINSNAGDHFILPLGTEFSALSNLEEVIFRFYFFDASDTFSHIHRLDNISLTDSSPPDPTNGLLTNGDFEDLPFLNGWTATGVTSETGQNGSNTSARLGFGTAARLGQSFAALTDFTLDCIVEVAGDSTDSTFHIFIDGDGGTALELSGGSGNTLQLTNGSSTAPLLSLSGNAPFPFAGNSPVRIRIVGRNFGNASASYDIAWSNPGESNFSHAATNLTAFVAISPATTGSGATGVRFDRANSSEHSYWLDEVILTHTQEPIPSSDYTFVAPPPPKVVNISGVYPHLAMTNNSNECGPGAIVPWADRLWCVTYSPHEANGSSSKLYEIDRDLTQIIRPESLGGTPANRFIHQPSNQLIIGPHFIDADRNVRNLPYSQAPGRHTGVAAHLADPDNRIYLMTMENGLYDVDVNDLSVITRYPDVQGRGDRFLHGYHGKGLYSGQNLLVAANNGRPSNQEFPTGEAGVLATWDGTTVANNGGSYFSANDPNTGLGDNGAAPVAAQPEFMAGWNQIAKVQTCEVTGPGGIYGNSNPATDPIWTTGFDAKSVILRTLESGTWHTFRLPKGSYTHDGSHGWHTEWPRIRQLDPDVPSSPYLMHMHGLFYDFPADFSASQFGNLSPISSYYKMPVDYCLFDGQLVIAKNDASKFSNALAQKAQSNFWFGQLSDLSNWGAPNGHGAVWMNESLDANQYSDPFLVNGFTQTNLHLKNADNRAQTVKIEQSYGDGNWTLLSILTLPPNSYLLDILAGNDAPWIRLKARNANSDFTAFFHLSNPYPHAPIPSRVNNQFAALADIKDTSGYSDGVIRVMAGSELKLEFASDSGYHQIGGPMVLEDILDNTLEAELRSEAELTQEFGSDEASAWIEEDGVRFRVPKLDPLYDQPFLSGWARGEREAVTERKLFNLHGTFYEIPRSNSGGVRKMRALATHGKRITDFASWRGLFVLTGVLDDADESDSLVKSPDKQAALWLGEIDDLWKMGEPRGTGGPWLDSEVTANLPSDAFLFYGFDKKSLELSHAAAAPVTIRLEVDFLSNDTWATYESFTVNPGETLTFNFPNGFHAHWVRTVCDTTTRATAQFTLGPVEQRDAFLDWARDNGIATGNGRQGADLQDTDGDGIPNCAEFVLGTNPQEANPWPSQIDSESYNFVRRDHDPNEPLHAIVQGSDDLVTWENIESLLTLHPDQSEVPAGYSKFQLPLTSLAEMEKGTFFLRIKIL